VGKHGLHFRLFGDIRLEEGSLPAVLFNDAFRILCAGFIAVVIDEYVGASLGKTDGNSLSQTFAGSGDKCFLTLQNRVDARRGRFIWWRIGNDGVTPSGSG
jgi:hypothetical protein